MPKKKHHRSHSASKTSKKKQAAAAAAAGLAGEDGEAVPAVAAPPPAAPEVTYGRVQGLENLGNTCFFNSVLQVLQAAPQLQVHYGADGDESGLPDGPLGAGIREVFLQAQQEALQAGRFKTSTHSPKQLLGAITEIAPQFKGRQQHDSHEVLRCLLDGLQSEEEKLAKAQSQLIRRASDVEEGLVFRQLSNSHQHGSSFAPLMVDVMDGAMPGGDSNAPPPAFLSSETDDAVPAGAGGSAEQEEAGGEMPEAADVFGEEGGGALSVGVTETDPLAALATNARQSISPKLLRRVLSAPVAGRGVASAAKDFAAPALEIAEASAARLLRSALQSAKAEAATHNRLRRVQSAAVRSTTAPPMPLIQEDDKAGAEADSDTDEDEEAPTRTTVDWFAGELSSSISCGGCTYVSSSKEPFLDLSLQVPWSSALLATQTRSNPNPARKVHSASNRAPGNNPKESKRLLKEAKKREKQERRRSIDSKREAEFELVLTPAQQAEAGGGQEADGASPKEEGAGPESAHCNGDSLRDTALSDKIAAMGDEVGGPATPLMGKEATEQEGAVGAGAAEAEEDPLLSSMDALAGCEMEAEDGSGSDGNAANLPEWDPNDGAFSLFSDQESSPKVHAGPLPRPAFSKPEDEEVGAGGEEGGAIHVLGCLSSFFKPEDIEWECPQESGKLSVEDEASAKPQKPAVAEKPVLPPEQKLARRVSFAGYGDDDDDAPSKRSGPPKRRVAWSREVPEIFKIPGSEEQRGTDPLEAMKGNATFNKPFKYSGNDFIARVRLDAWSGDRLDVIVGPNWDEDAEDMWPDEQKVADVQIDPIEDINDEAAQDLLKSQAQLLLDCFSDLFVCQGPHGMLNILRAGYPDLDEKKCADGETRWVVMGRFPPGQIGGAKMWCYPPDSEASAAMFSPMGGESPAASPTLNTPLHSKIGRGELKSSLKSSQASVLAAELQELTLRHSPQPHGGVAASPPIAHFPPNASFPHTDADDASENGTGGEGGGVSPQAETDTIATEDFERKEVGPLPLSSGSALTELMHADGVDAKDDDMETEEGEDGSEDAATTTKLAGALASGEGAKYVRRARKDPNAEPADDEGAEAGAKSAVTTQDSADGSDPVQSATSEASPKSPTPKGSLRKCVQRPAVKRYQIHRAPDLLTVHLKRFQQNMRGRLEKISGSIPFDFHLDLSQFCDPNGLEKNGARYELLGVVVHSGTLRGGHYVAYVRRTAQVLHSHDDAQFPPKWHFVSDSFAKPVEESEVLACEAYMLLYNRIP
eukprot:jgi/Tetstr1/462792/TSEL_007743.t1